MVRFELVVNRQHYGSRRANAAKTLIHQQASRAWGVLSGLDRLRFRGFLDFDAFAQDSRDAVWRLGKLVPHENPSFERLPGEVVTGLVRWPKTPRRARLCATSKPALRAL